MVEPRSRSGTANGAGSAALSPPLASSSSRSASRAGAVSSPRPKFPADQLRPYMRSLLSSTLNGAAWDAADKQRMSALSKEVSERVKSRMIDLEPRGFKYIVTATLTENLGQAGRADMSCHWEESDTVVQEMYSNDTIIFVCVAFAVRVL